MPFCRPKCCACLAHASAADRSTVRSHTKDTHKHRVENWSYRAAPVRAAGADQTKTAWLAAGSQAPYCFRFSAGCCFIAAASAAAPDLHRLLAAAHPQMHPADRNHQLARLISQLCPSAGSACALLQPAVSHSCALSHYTARRIHSCKADPDNAWTVGPADELGVSWRAERALFELLLNASAGAHKDSGGG